MLSLITSLGNFFHTNWTSYNHCSKDTSILPVVWSPLQIFKWDHSNQIWFHSCLCVSPNIMVASGGGSPCDQYTLNLSSLSTGCWAHLLGSLSFGISLFFWVWNTNSCNFLLSIIPRWWAALTASFMQMTLKIASDEESLRRLVWWNPSCSS